MAQIKTIYRLLINGSSVAAWSEIGKKKKGNLGEIRGLRNGSEHSVWRSMYNLLTPGRAHLPWKRDWTARQTEWLCLLLAYMWQPASCISSCSAGTIRAWTEYPWCQGWKLRMDPPKIMDSPSLWLICLPVAFRWPTSQQQRAILRPDRAPSPEETNKSPGGKVSYLLEEAAIYLYWNQYIFQV